MTDDPPPAPHLDGAEQRLASHLLAPEADVFVGGGILVHGHGDDAVWGGARLSSRVTPRGCGDEGVRHAIDVH